MKLRKLPIPYIYCILIGIILGIFLGTRFYWTYMLYGEVEEFDWQRYFASPFVNQFWWGVLVPLVFYCYNRFDINRQRFLAILASIAVALFHEVTSYFVWLVPMDFFGVEKFEWESIPRIIKTIPAGFISQWIEYWIIWAIFFGLDYARRYKDKEVELTKMENQLSNAQLSALRLQLQPHFLFNTLNTISSLMEFNKTDAQKIVTRLGNLLRTVLDKNQSSKITLEEEMNFTSSYLDIEQIRFHDRLSIEYLLEKETLNKKVPSLILQPLVENAIKHGIAPSSEGGKITISSKLLGENRFQIEVKDSGGGTNIASKDLFEKGIGLRNVKERLDLIYKDLYQMDIHSKEGAGFQINLILPIQS